MTRNNFKRLEENFLEEHPEAPLAVKKEVSGTVGLIGMIGRVIEMYFPKVFDVFIVMNGGEAPSQRPEEAGIRTSNGAPKNTKRGPSLPPS